MTARVLSIDEAQQRARKKTGDNRRVPWDACLPHSDFSGAGRIIRFPQPLHNSPNNRSDLHESARPSFLSVQPARVYVAQWDAIISVAEALGLWSIALLRIAHLHVTQHGGSTCSDHRQKTGQKLLANPGQKPSGDAA